MGLSTVESLSARSEPAQQDEQDKRPTDAGTGDLADGTAGVYTAMVSVVARSARLRRRDRGRRGEGKADGECDGVFSRVSW